MPDTPADDRQFTTFTVAGQRFGLDILAVREIVAAPHLTPVPHAPAAVLGYVNLRGAVHLVLDLRRLLVDGDRDGDRDGNLSTTPHLMVLKPDVVESCALSIDTVGDIVSVPPERLEPVRPGVVADATLVAGLCRLDDEVLVILDPRRVADLATG